MEPVYTNLLILALAAVVDLLIGEPPSILHPTVWMGRISEVIEKRLWLGQPMLERVQGIILAVLVLSLFTLPTYYGLNSINLYLGFIPFLITSVFVQKSTFAVKAMERFTMPIAEAAIEGDYEKARELLRKVVRRDPNQLTDQQVLSATVETIAEGTVDGVTGPIFLYSILGVPGAVAYRVINTLDSTVGYQDRDHLYIGWFSAALDTVANYFPSRITGVLTIISSAILSCNWSNCLRMLERDHARTTSLNAGWPISAMAGALGVILEKPGSYMVGESSRMLTPADITKALKIMKLNVALFAILVCVPLITVCGILAPIV
jgi:adenosylcobinamide-phosphate synthase